MKCSLRFKISGRGLGGIRAQDAFSSVLAFTTISQPCGLTGCKKNLFMPSGCVILELHTPANDLSRKKCNQTPVKIQLCVTLGIRCVRV